MREGGENIRSLQGCINDLVSLLALPAMWTGSDAPRILGILLDVLLRMLCLDFAYARLNSAADAVPIEICRVQDRRNIRSAGSIGRTLDPWLGISASNPTTGVPNPVGKGEIRIARACLGLGYGKGVVVAGSNWPDFPSDIEFLLLKTAVN